MGNGTLAVAACAGHVYVADAVHRCVHVFRGDNGAFVRAWSVRALGSPPSAIAVVPAAAGGGAACVAVAGQHRVALFSAADGAPVRAWQVRGPTPQGVQVAASAAEVFVVDPSTCSVHVFRPDSSVRVRRFELSSDLGDALRSGGAALWAAAGQLLVTSPADHSVCAFRASDGLFLRRWGVRGRRDGQLDFPAGIAVTWGGEVLVTDKHVRCQVFRAADGAFLRSFGSRSKWSSGEVAVAADERARVVLGATGDGRVLVFE